MDRGDYLSDKELELLLEDITLASSFLEVFRYAPYSLVLKDLRIRRERLNSWKNSRDRINYKSENK